jgi:MFS family permease
MIDKVIAALAAVAGALGYYLTTVTHSPLVLVFGLVVAVLGAGSAFIGGKVIAHHAPDLAAMLIQGWRVMLFVVTALLGTVVGLEIKSRFSVTNNVALAVVGAVPALAAFSSGVVEKYSTGWFAYRSLARYRNLWPSYPPGEQEKGREAWRRANNLPKSPYNKEAWTLKATENTLQAFKDAIEAGETTGT